MTTPDERGYNGWTNYETWAAALWLDNESYSYNMWREFAREAVGRALEDDPALQHTRGALLQAAAILLSDQLNDWLEGESPLAGQASLYADLMSAALGEISTREIAENWLDDGLDEALKDWLADNGEDEEEEIEEDRNETHVVKIYQDGQIYSTMLFGCSENAVDAKELFESHGHVVEIISFCDIDA